MNLVGRSYIAARSHLRLSPQKHSRQQSLTQRFLHEWRSHQAIDDERLLQETLRQAHCHVPFYRQYFSAHPHKNPARIQDWPILTRDLLRDEFESLKSNTPFIGKSWTHASGGSTGKPVAVVHDEYFAAKAQALRELCAELFFGGPHYNKLILWGMSHEIETQKNGDKSLKSAIKNRLLTFGGLKTSHINTFSFTRDKFGECVRILRRQKPHFIFGYAGSVYQLAKYMEEHDIKIKHRVEKIGTTAQTLYPFMREKIESVFDCQVCDHYGSREVGPIAWQHPDGDMYFPRFFSKVEVVNSENKACAPGEPGRILVTTLHNMSMPLIRYEIGDKGVQGPEAIYRGYPFSTLKEISGKSNEEFVTRDGTLVHGQFFINLFYYQPWLDEFQVVQKAYERIQILYMLKRGEKAAPASALADIEARIKDAMTQDCVVEWLQVSQMPTTPAGKRLYVRSEVSAGHSSPYCRQPPLWLRTTSCN